MPWSPEEVRAGPGRHGSAVEFNLVLNVLVIPSIVVVNLSNVIINL